MCNLWPPLVLLWAVSFPHHHQISAASAKLCSPGPSQGRVFSPHLLRPPGLPVPVLRLEAHEAVVALAQVGVGRAEVRRRGWVRRRRVRRVCVRDVPEAHEAGGGTAGGGQRLAVGIERERMTLRDMLCVFGRSWRGTAFGCG